jgi:drug/metabolite transporter (DMT)-like permease
VIQVQKPVFIDYLYLVILSAIWGSAFVAIEYALNGFSPFLIGFGRIFISALFLYIIVKYQGLLFTKDKNTWILLFIIGALNNAIPFVLIPWGQQFISASTASVMLAMGPFLALVLSHYITNDEKFTFLKLLSVFLGFAGVFILFGQDFFTGDENSIYGKIALLLAVCGYISSGFLIRKITNLPTVVTSASMFMTASILMIPYLFIFDFSSYNNDIFSTYFVAIIYLAIVPTAIASLFRIVLVRKVGVQFMSQVAYLIPIFAIIWSWIFFDEKPAIILLIAMAFVFTGLFIRNLKH